MKREREIPIFIIREKKKLLDASNTKATAFSRDFPPDNQLSHYTVISSI